MGIITRQSIKGTIYSYIGVILGFINVGLLMPHIFSTEEIGLVNLLVALSAIIGQFGTLGMMNVTIRQFPFFRDKEKKHNGFLFLLMSVGLFGFLLSALGYYASKDWLIETNIEKSPLFAEYVYLLLPLIFATIFFFLLDTYNRMFFNASFGIFVKEFLLRILNLLGIILFYLKVFDFHEFIIFYTIVYGVPTILLCLLLIIRGEFSLKPDFKFINSKILREIISVALFGIVSGFSGLVVMQVDRYLVNHYCSLSDTGIYSTVFFFGSVILMPGRSLIRIASTSIAEAFKKENIDEVNKIYSGSTINLSIIGLLLFLLVWINTDNILMLLPDEFSSGKMVIFYIALGHLLQMYAGISGEIIQFGKYYKEHSLIMIFLIICIVVFNIILLPVFGITGAGIAFAVSFLIYWIIRVWFVYSKYKLFPYKNNFLKLNLIGILSLIINALIPKTPFIFDVLIRTSVITSIFFALIIYLRISEDYNQKALALIERIKRYLADWRNHK